MKMFRLLLERTALSSGNYWASLIGDVIGALVFLIVGLDRFSGPWTVSFATIAVGFLCWGFLEYALHRWVLHGRLSLPRRGHAQHHVNAAALVSTPVLVIAACAAGVCALLGVVIDPGLAAMAVFGVYSGYNYFALLHHMQHHEPETIGRFAYFRTLGRFHAIHHQKQTVNYGTTTLLWDRLLGTFQGR